MAEIRCQIHETVANIDGAPILGVVPQCEDPRFRQHRDYGAWSDDADGFLFLDRCATAVAAWVAEQYLAEPDFDSVTVIAACPDHEERPFDGCEQCWVQDEDEGEAR